VSDARSVTVYSAPTRDVCAALGSEIARVRRERRWSQTELAERVGVALGTIRAVEKGAPSVTLGVAVEAATVLGIDLLGGPAAAARAADNRRTLALLPQRVRSATLHPPGDRLRRRVRKVSQQSRRIELTTAQATLEWLVPEEQLQRSMGVIRRSVRDARPPTG
jgi:transcriptional regulator with XRE-family HTH domain